MSVIESWCKKEKEIVLDTKHLGKTLGKKIYM